jgi:hypothetical protein
MELVTELRENSHAASATLLRGQVIDETAFNARPAHNEILEFDCDPTEWHTHHRLDDFQSNLYHEPEKMLMFAILVDAIMCFDKLSAAAGMPRYRKGLEARNWLCSNRQDWPFAYRNVCEVLGFDPDYLRRGLLGRIQMPRPDSRRGETHGLPLKKPILAGTRGLL